MKQRIALLVYVDLDPVPGGAFSDEKSALDCTADILDQRVGHYNPIVSFAPDELQPPNRPRPSISQEIPRPETYLPLAGTTPSDIGVLTTADIAMTYNTEGHVEA